MVCNVSHMAINRNHTCLYKSRFVNVKKNINYNLSMKKSQDSPNISQILKDLLFHFDQQSSGLYLIAVLARAAGAVNVSKHRKEGREDGRTPLPREMRSALFVRDTHTHIIHTGRSYLARWCDDEIPYPVNPCLRSSDSDHPSWVRLVYSYTNGRIWLLLSQHPGMKTFPILTILLPVSWISVPPPLASGMFLHFQAGTAVLLATGSIAITSIFNHHILYPAIEWSAITFIHHSLPAGFRCPPGVTVDFHFVS